MVRTGAPGVLEHIAAYLITGIIVAVGYGPRPVGYLLLAVLLTTYAGLLEIGQVWVPGRHAGPLDFAASALGMFLGTGIVGLTHRRRERVTEP